MRFSVGEYRPDGSYVGEWTCHSPRVWHGPRNEMYCFEPKPSEVEWAAIVFAWRSARFIEELSAVLSNGKPDRDMWDCFKNPDKAYVPSWGMVDAIYVSARRYWRQAHGTPYREAWGWTDKSTATPEQPWGTWHHPTMTLFDGRVVNA